MCALANGINGFPPSDSFMARIDVIFPFGIAWKRARTVDNESLGGILGTKTRLINLRLFSRKPVCNKLQVVLRLFSYLDERKLEMRRFLRKCLQFILPQHHFEDSRLPLNFNEACSF